MLTHCEKPGRRATARERQAGIGLIELMIAMAIGLFLISGAFFVYSKSRSSSVIADTIARMQENARFALDTLEPDLRLAGYWGLHRSTSQIEGRANNNPLGVAIGGDCLPNWSITLTQHVGGTNNNPPGWNCINNADIQANTDILAVRRAGANQVTVLQPGQIYMRSSEEPRSELFVGAAAPGGFSVDARDFPLIAHAYFVRPYTFSATEVPLVPALRRAELVTVGGAPVMQQREIIPGVEDMQIQFGISPPGAPSPGSVGRYVNPDNPLLGTPGVEVHAVRVWLLMRAQAPEREYDDQKTYVMGDRTVTAPPPVNNMDFRRLLVSRTIHLRNP